jgi:putative molybdopterin biosynthesis protein
MSGGRAFPKDAALELLAAVREAARQDQFLDVIPAAEARSRFEAAIDFTPLPDEMVDLADAL